MSNNGFVDLIDVEDDEQKKKQRTTHSDEIDTSLFPTGILARMQAGGVDNAILRSEELQPENASEIWVLQCPSNVQLAQLIQGKKLYLDDRPQKFSSSENAGKEFEVVCLPQDTDGLKGISVVLPNEAGKMQIMSLPLSGHIMLKAAIEEVPPGTPFQSPNKVRQLPSGVKVRHPVYGADYDDIIQDLPFQLPASNEKRKKRRAVNEDGFEAQDQPPTKKSKKTHTEFESGPQAITQTRKVSQLTVAEVEVYEEEPARKRKKSKRVVEAEVEVIEIDEEALPVRPKKKSKHGTPAFEESLLHQVENAVKKKKRVKQEIVDEAMTSLKASVVKAFENSLPATAPMKKRWKESV